MPRSHKIKVLPQVYKLVHFEQSGDVILHDGQRQSWKYTIVGPCRMGVADIIKCTHYGSRTEAIESIRTMMVQMHRRYNDMAWGAQKLPKQLMDEIEVNVSEVVEVVG